MLAPVWNDDSVQRRVVVDRRDGSVREWAGDTSIPALDALQWAYWTTYYVSRGRLRDIESAIEELERRHWDRVDARRLRQRRLDDRRARAQHAENRRAFDRQQSRRRAIAPASGDELIMDGGPTEGLAWIRRFGSSVFGDTSSVAQTSNVAQMSNVALRRRTGASLPRSNIHNMLYRIVATVEVWHSRVLIARLELHSRAHCLFLEQFVRGDELFEIHIRSLCYVRVPAADCAECTERPASTTTKEGSEGTESALPRSYHVFAPPACDRRDEHEDGGDYVRLGDRIVEPGWLSFYEVTDVSYDVSCHCSPCSPCSGRMDDVNVDVPICYTVEPRGPDSTAKRERQEQRRKYRFQHGRASSDDSESESEPDDDQLARQFARQFRCIHSAVAALPLPLDTGGSSSSTSASASASRDDEEFTLLTCTPTARLPASSLATLVREPDNSSAVYMLWALFAFIMECMNGTMDEQSQYYSFWLGEARWPSNRSLIGHERVQELRARWTREHERLSAIGTRIADEFKHFTRK